MDTVDTASCVTGCAFCGAFCDNRLPADPTNYCKPNSLQGEICFVCDYTADYVMNGLNSASATPVPSPADPLWFNEKCIQADGTAGKNKINRTLITPFIDNAKLDSDLPRGGSFFKAGDYINFLIDDGTAAKLLNPITFSFFVKIMGLDYEVYNINLATSDYSIRNSVEIFAFSRRLRLIYYNNKAADNFDALELTILPLATTTDPNIVLARVLNFSKYFGNYCHIGLAYDDLFITNPSLYLQYPPKINFEVQMANIPILVTDPMIYKSTELDFTELGISNRVFGLWADLKIFNNYFIGIYAFVSHNFSSDSRVIPANYQIINPTSSIASGECLNISQLASATDVPAPASGYTLGVDYLCYNDYDSFLDTIVFNGASMLITSKNAVVTGGTSKKIIPDNNFNRTAAPTFDCNNLLYI